jgi:hypothetical protein
MKRFNIVAPGLTYRHVLELAGARCELQTNSQQLLSTLNQWFVTRDEANPCNLWMQVLVNAGESDFNRNGHFRGLHHVAVASFGAGCVFVFDLLRRNISAMVTEKVARDRLFWDEILLPVAVGVLGATIGVIPVHCACLSTEGEALIIAGVSGAGKSTLSAALAQAGFDYISDDWTYFNQQSQILTAHGMAAKLKLLPDAASHFPNLSDQLASPALNGELAYQVTADVFGSTARRTSVPRWGIFLERTSEPGCEFAKTTVEEARTYLNSSVERLPPQLDEVFHARARILDQIADLPWWVFRYGGTPHFAAQQLRSFVSQKQAAIV